LKSLQVLAFGEWGMGSAGHKCGIVKGDEDGTLGSDHFPESKDLFSSSLSLLTRAHLPRPQVDSSMESLFYFGRLVVGLKIRLNLRRIKANKM
jgi:hypothetical protein